MTAGMPVELAMLVSSTSRPCCLKMPASNAIHSGRLVAIGLLYETLSDVAAAGLVAAGAAAGGAGVGGGGGGAPRRAAGRSRGAPLSRGGGARIRLSSQGAPGRR